MRNNKSIFLLIAIILILSSSYFIYYETETKSQFNSKSINENVAGLEDKTSHDHSISFSESPEGKICEKCGGTGQILTGTVSKNITCPTCGGTGQTIIGYIEVEGRILPEYGTCPDCNGTKVVTREFPDYSICPYCNGTGIIQYISLTEIDEKAPTTEIIVIIGAAVGVAGLLGVLVTEWGKYKLHWFLPLLGPLYLRTVKEEVFDNQKRLCMYTHIAENQPVVYSEIKKICKLSDGEINWHAHMMIQFDLIKTQRKGFHLFFYLAKSPRLSPDDFIRLTDIQRSIFELIVEIPGITQAEIIEKIGLKQQNISYNLLKLEEKGKIKVEKKEKIKVYYPLKRNSSSN